MKKFIIPILCNILMLAVIPFAFGFLDEETSKSAWVGMLVVGNSAYFFIQGQFFSSKHKGGWQLVIINILSTMCYMYVFITQIVLLYVAFYTMMMAFGIRVGSNKRKLDEYNKNLQNKE